MIAFPSTAWGKEDSNLRIRVRVLPGTLPVELPPQASRRSDYLDRRQRTLNGDQDRDRPSSGEDVDATLLNVPNHTGGATTGQPHREGEVSKRVLDLNQRPLGYEPSALPTALTRQVRRCGSSVRRQPG